MCPATAVLSEGDIVRPLTPHNGHPSPMPRVLAKNAEYVVFSSVDPVNCSLRELLSKMLIKYRELNLDISLMSKENALKTELRKRKKQVQDKTGPFIKSFFDLGGWAFYDSFAVHECSDMKKSNQIDKIYEKNLFK